MDSSLQFADVSHEADHHDSWLFSSTTRYQHINMYEVVKTSQAAIWVTVTEQEYICYATNESMHNEILLYAVPSCKDSSESLGQPRELSIAAAGSCTAATKLLHSAPNSFKDPLLVARTEHLLNKVFIYQMPEHLESDIISDIALVTSLQPGNDNSEITSVYFGPVDSVYSASLTSNVHITDLTTEQSVYCRFPDRLSEIGEHEYVTCFINDVHTGSVWCCTNLGSLTRLSKDGIFQSFIKVPDKYANKTAKWEACPGTGYDIILSNDHNAVIVVDSRKSNEPRLAANVESSPWTGRKLNQYFKLSSHSNMISISGKDNAVRIYDLQKLTKDSVNLPVFTHDGHLPDWDNSDWPVVTNHCWNYSVETPRILSTTNTAQLHTWMFGSHTDK